MVEEPTALVTQPPSTGPWTWVVGLLAPFLAMVLFFIGWSAMDSLEPAVGRAGAFYAFSALLATGGVVYVVLRHPDQMLWTGILGGVGALILGYVVAGVAQDGYNDIVVPFVIGWFVAPAIVFGYLVTMLILGLKFRSHGIIMATMGWCFTVCAGMLGASMYHLLTLNAQAARATEAHEASAISWLVAGSLFVLVAAWARRPRC